MGYVINEGTVILKENEVSMDMYQIEKGHVELYKDYGTRNETILGILSKGDFFGEIGFLTKKPSIYTAVAYDDVVVNKIPIDNVISFIKEYPYAALLIMKNMANTMYNLKFDIDLLAKERVIDAEQIAKHLLKYNMNMYMDGKKKES